MVCARCETCDVGAERTLPARFHKNLVSKVRMPVAASTTGLRNPQNWDCLTIEDLTGRGSPPWPRRLVSCSSNIVTPVIMIPLSL